MSVSPGNIAGELVLIHTERVSVDVYNILDLLLQIQSAIPYRLIHPDVHLEKHSLRPFGAIPCPSLSSLPE